MVKCPHCEEKLDKDESHEYKKRYYHPKCLEEKEKEDELKRKQPSKEDREKTERKELLDYINELYRGKANFALIGQQLKTMKAEGLKYKGMELALRYFYDTLDNRMQDHQGIGIIPFVYEDAKNHYIKQLKIAKSVQDFNTEEKTVYIDTSKTKRKNKKIDISAI